MGNSNSSNIFIPRHQ